jgi:hypothetical protein
MGGAWLSQHLWDHYAFTGDRVYLQQYAYPLMKGAAQFCLDWLVEDKQGRYVTALSTSPENVFVTETGAKGSVSVATTMDMGIIWDVFSNVIQASEQLGVDADFRKTLLDKKKFTGTGSILRSSDLKRYVYVEQKVMTSDETNEMYSGSVSKIPYNIMKPDGSTKQVTTYNSGKLILTNSGAIVTVNGSTGEVFIDGKPAGKFALKDGYQINSESLLIGSDPNNMAYYDGNAGSINYMDGSSKKLGVMYPKVVGENGKNYLQWFRKCKNDIYLAKFVF